MSLRRQIALLVAWAALCAMAAGIVVWVKRPQPPAATLGTLFAAAADTSDGTGAPQQRLSTDPAHPTIVGTGSVTWWDAAGGEHRTPINDQSLVLGIFWQDGYRNFTADTGVPLQTLLLIIVPTLIVVMVIVILYWRGGTSGVARLLRWPGRRGTQDRPATRFSDVAGCDEAKLELGEVVDFLRDPGRYRALGARVPRGVLLVGPPGTGKTLLARAVAGEAECAFLALSGSEFVEMFVGVGAARVRDLFARARRSAPSIVFLDEIDAVGRRRGAASPHAGHEEREQTLNQLLVEMDGFDQAARIVVIAATNRPDVLDEALLRPGRFDRTVSVDAPDVSGRRAILELHTRGKPLAATADLALLARRTPGFTGADLANLANEAALLAARDRAAAIGMDHLERAVDRVLAGPERKGRLVSLEERRIIAHHEMGHALVLASLPGTDPVRRVSLVGRGRSLGWTLTVPEDDRVLGTRSQLTARLCGLLGGRAAEELLLGPDDVTTGAADDLLKATRLARQMVSELGMSPLGVRVVESGEPGDAGRPPSDDLARRVDAEVDRLLTDTLQRARRILLERRGVLEALASRLLEAETMSAEEMAEVISDHPRIELRGLPAPRRSTPAGAPAAVAAPPPSGPSRAPAAVAATAEPGAPPAAVGATRAAAGRPRLRGARAALHAVRHALGRSRRGSPST
jgi:cell division protease FtsH